VSLRAYSYLPNLKLELARRMLTKWSLTHSATSLPPWPSKTPKTWISFYIFIAAIWESSILFLQPYIEQAAYLKFWKEFDSVILVLLGVVR